MSLHQPWIEFFKISPEALGGLHAKADPELSLVHTALLEGLLPEEDYLSWAMETFELPRVKPDFQLEAHLVQALEPLKTVFKWRQDFHPAGLWGNTLYIFCHEPTELKLEDYKVQYVLAPASWLKESWNHIGAAFETPDQSPPIEDSVPSFDLSGEMQNTQAEVAAPEAPAEVAAPEGLSSSASSDTDQLDVPEGLSFGSLEPPEMESPDQEAAPEEEIAPPEGMAGFSTAASSPSSEEEPAMAPEGMFKNAASVSVSFASLTHPDDPKVSPAASEAPVEPVEPVAPAASEEPAARAAPIASEIPAAAPAASVPALQRAEQPLPELAALKIKPEDAAQLPPLPQPFGVQTTHFPEPDPAPTELQPQQQQQQQQPQPQVQQQTPQGQFKTEWTLAEVSRVTLLKPEGQTVSRTLELSHLTSSEGTEMQVCKAVSDERVAHAQDDVRKANNLEELSLNTFKVMKTYFANSIFFVFLNGNLIPWRWTQSWPRPSDTPPGPIDLSSPSIFKIAFQTALPYHGYVVPSPVNDAFFREWNHGILPDHVTLMPVKAGQLIAGLMLGMADRTSLDYKYSLKFMEGLSVNISQALQDMSVKSAS